MISRERLYLTADKSTVVKDGDPRAAFLLVGANCEIDDATARRYGLVATPVAEPEAVAEVQPEPEPEPKPEPSEVPKPAAKAPAFKPVAAK